MNVYHDRYRPKSEHEGSLDNSKQIGAPFIKQSNLNFPRSTRRSSSDTKYSSPNKKRSYSHSPSREHRRRPSYSVDRPLPFYAPHHRRCGRSKSSSNDIIFVERRHRHGSHKHIPPEYEYSGKLKVRCMDKRLIRVPCVYPQGEPPLPPMRPIPEQYPMPPPPPQPFLPPLICDPPVMLPDYPPMGGRYDCGSMEMWPQPYGGGMMEGPPPPFEGSSSYYSRGYPPIPPGGKIIAQYEKDFEEVSYRQPPPPPPMQPMPPPPPPPMQPMPQPYQPCERVVEACVPRAKVIEVWRKARRSRPKEPMGPSLEQLRKDLIDSITAEIKKLDLGDRRPIIQPAPVQPVEREVKVIVQPIQPVFYMPKQEPVAPTIIHQPAPMPMQPPPQPAPQPLPPPPPSVVYVPRNVYVPVIKPVFVPRERVIVRPQIVQVARPVVIDRPVPVAQRPIVIDRELPVPFPVCNRGGQAVADVCQEQYIYRDNLPLAYGGRRGEFATGMNYGYVPVNENYQYVVSGCDDTLRQQLVDSSGYNYTGTSYGDCFDAALAEAESGSSSYTHQHQHAQPGLHIPVSILSSAPPCDSYDIGKENRNALIETLRRAGTGCNNLEVLDPTIRPCWEPVDAKILIQRYGRNAAHFVESGVSYGYVTSPVNRMDQVGSGSENCSRADANVHQVDSFSPIIGSRSGNLTYEYQRQPEVDKATDKPLDFDSYRYSDNKKRQREINKAIDQPTDFDCYRYSTSSFNKLADSRAQSPASDATNSDKRQTNRHSYAGGHMNLHGKPDSFYTNVQSARTG